VYHVALRYGHLSLAHASEGSRAEKASPLWR
jgi:hypothetical protein